MPTVEDAVADGRRHKKIVTGTLETWRSIPGHSNYEASSFGRIRSIDRMETLRNQWGPICRKRAGRILHTIPSNNGYLRVSMYRHMWKGVHRLVALAFHGEPSSGRSMINHKDGNKENNCPENLEWCSASQNEQHSYSVLGKTPWNKGKRYDTAKAVAVRRKNYREKCLQTRALVGQGNLTLRAAAKELGLSDRQVSERLHVARLLSRGE